MAKKQLPVIAAKPAAEAAEPEDDRPPWHWIGFGTVAIFAAWLPGSALAGALGGRVARSLGGGPEAPITLGMRAAVALPQLAAAAFAAFAGGYLVGRFGAKTTPREATLAGVTATLFACALAAQAAGFSPLLLVVGVALIPAAFLGGRRGVQVKRGERSI
jgi:hypothetical protein